MNQQEAAPAALQTERKFAVLLFADLSGYTRLCEELDPEQVVAALHPVMASLRAAAESEGGVICSTAGDGFFVSFGVPSAVEDPAYRASAAAQAMRALIDSANSVEQPVRIPPVHIGIAAGEVLVVPTQELVGFSLVGSAVNLASRLCDAAPADAVYMDRQTHRLLADRAKWLPPLSVDIRGLDEPVTTWPLDRLITDLPRTGSGSFVGRAEELHALDQHLERVTAQGRGVVVVVGGIAGIGKTQLLQQWLVRHPDILRIGVQCSDAARGSLDDVLRALGPDPRMSDTSALATELLDEATVTTDRPDPFPAMLARARRLLVAASSSAPVALTIEDAHHTDPSLTALIDELKRHPLPGPVLCVATARTGEQLDDIEVDLNLDGLSTDEVQVLVRTTWPALLDRDIVAPLVERLGGHPLMTVQVLSYLEENTGLAELDELPSSLRLFVASRLDRLPAREKAVIQRLSTLGTRFGTEQIETVLEDATSEDLDRLVRRRLLRQVTHDQVEFEHGIVQEVAYMSLPRAARGDLHRRHLARLPEHGDEATRCFHAVRWAESAAVGSLDERNAAVAAALNESLELARHLFRTEARSAHGVLSRVTPFARDSAQAAPETAVQILLLDARCRLEMWDFHGAEEVAARAVEIAGRLGLPADTVLDASIVHAMSLTRLRRPHAARAVIDQVIAATERTGDDVRRSRALRVLASTWRYESPAKLATLCEESYAVGHAAEDPAATATAQYLAYLTSVAAGNTYERWRRVAESETADSDVWGHATLARAATMRAIYSLDFATASVAAQRASTLGDELGAYDVVGDALLAQVDVATAQGDLSLVAPLLKRLSDLCEQTGHMRLQMFTWSCSALPALRRGDVHESDKALADAATLSEDFGPAARAEIAYVRALVEADRGQFREALLSLDEARAETSDGQVALEVLLHRVREALISVNAGLKVSGEALESLVDACHTAGAPRLASYAEAVVDLHCVAAEDRVLRPAPAEAGLEERGIRADSAALLAEHNGGDAHAAWQHAASIWGQLGYTVWLARAQARSGDTAAAERTLDLIQAGDEGRAWALQR